MGILDAAKAKIGEAAHGVEDAFKGAGKAVEAAGVGVENAAKDSWHGTVETLKSVGHGLSEAGHDLKVNTEKGVHDVQEGVKNHDLLGTVGKVQRDFGAGMGQALSHTWNGVADGAGKALKGTENVVRDLGQGASKAYDAGVDGASHAVADVAGKKAGDMVRTVAQAAAAPVREEAKFAFGAAEGFSEGALGIVRGTGDLVVGAVRMGSDADFRDNLIKKAGQTATSLGHLAQKAWDNPDAAAHALGQAAKSEYQHIVHDGQEAARKGNFSEWSGHAVGEVGAQVASFFVAPAKAGQAANALDHAGAAVNALEKATEGGRAVEALAGVGKATKAMEAAVGVGKVEKAAVGAGKATESTGATRAAVDKGLLASLPPSEKIKAVLVDSGSGGGMTGALLDGEVRQLGAQFCLPLGAKPAEQAVSYTAAMILHPMIHDLAGAGGVFDGKVAEHVIIACNTASVQTEKALPMIADYVRDVAGDVNKTKYALNETERANVVDLGKRMGNDPIGYLRSHVHDVVTPTAKRGADTAADALIGDAGTKKPDFFVRVDSTAGTVRSGAYPADMRTVLSERFTKAGYDVVQERTWPTQAAGGDGHLVSHTMMEFSDGTDTRRVFIENRGNPPWVDRIEENALNRKQAGSKIGDRLVAQSNQASNKALDQLAPRLLNDNRDLADIMPPDVRAGFEHAPDLEMLSCTHYPAMQDFLASTRSGNKPPAKFLNQAEVVRDIVGDLRGTPATAERELSATPHLDIVQTMGTRADNGLQYKKTEGPLANPFSRVARKDLQRRESVIQRVVDQTRTHFGLDKPRATVRVVVPDQARELEFERLHRHLALQGAPPTQASKVMAQQNYNADFDRLADGTIKVKTAEALDPNRRLRPTPGDDYHPDVQAAMVNGVADRIEKLGAVVPTGEQRGMTILATAVDTGHQLREAAGQLGSIIRRNMGRTSGEPKEAVGILTGFKVIDNATRKALGCENDGPPGAVAMAKMLLDKGTPVSLVTDKGSEVVLMESLVGLKLAERTRGFLGRPGYRILNDELKVHVSGVNRLQQAIDMPRIKSKLMGDKVKALVSIERPSPNGLAGDGVRPIMTNMAGQDISAHNADFSSLFAKDDKWKPYTIGIGDGGNEMGMGNVSEAIRNLRKPNLELNANNGERIAGRSDVNVDALIVGSVSNTGGVGLAMATRAALGEGGFAADVSTYDDVIGHLYKEGLSLDGVSKTNALSVDNRLMGTFADSARNPDRMPGDVGATHHDMFREMIKAIK